MRIQVLQVSTPGGDKVTCSRPMVDLDDLEIAAAFASNTRSVIDHSQHIEGSKILFVGQALYDRFSPDDIAALSGANRVVTIARCSDAVAPGFGSAKRKSPVHAIQRAHDQHIAHIASGAPDASLDFTMQATSSGETVFQNHHVGYVTMLYLGYTFCPDVCPLTIQNVAAALAKTGTAAKHIRSLFVTVDPGRDTIPVLRSYVSLCRPDFVSLREDADQLGTV